jgi:protein-S-isoprenylcysteine O-methyltransferase Ste14
MDDSGKVVEHLKMIQPVITRMSSAMLSIKVFSLTVFSFLAGLAIKDKISEMSLIVFPLILVFLVFDVFYLWQEKLALQTIWWKRGKSGTVEAWKLQRAGFMRIL